MTMMVRDRFEQDTQVSLAALDQYARDVAWSVPLTSEEEWALFTCLEQARLMPSDRLRVRQAQEARDRVAAAYRPLVMGIARKMWRRCRCRSLELLDLVQEGTMGLLDAIDRYATPGKAFAPVATRCIANAMYRAYCSFDGLRMHPRMVKRLRWIAMIKGQLVGALGREPSFEEMAAAMGVEVQQVREWSFWEQRRTVESWEGLLEQGEQEEELGEAVNLLACSQQEERQPSAREVFERAFSSVLAPRQVQVLRMRYGFYEEDEREYTPAEVAHHLGVDVTTVCEAEQRALERLQEALDLTQDQGHVTCVLKALYSEHYCTLEQVRERLGVCEATVRSWIKSGRLPVVWRAWGKRGMWVVARAVVEALHLERQQAAA